MTGSDSNKGEGGSGKVPPGGTAPSDRTPDVSVENLLEGDGGGDHIDAEIEDQLLGPPGPTVPKTVNPEPNKTGKIPNGNTRTETVQLLHQDPGHPKFICNNQEIQGIMGLSYKPECPILRMTMKDALGDAPLSVATMPVKGFLLLAHVASISQDITIEPQDKERRTHDYSNPHFTTRGLCIAMDFFRKNCVHFLNKTADWKDIITPYYVEEQGIPPCDMFQHAWKLVQSDQIPVDGSKGVPNTRTSALFLPGDLFRNAKSRFDFVGTHLYFYDRMSDDIAGVVHTQCYKYIIIVGPSKIPRHHVMGSLKKIDNAIQTQQIRGALVPAPWCRRFDGDLFAVFADETEKLKKRNGDLGEPHLLRSFYPGEDHTHRVEDIHAILGVEPRERGFDPLTTHQMNVYFRNLAVALKDTSTPLPKFSVIQENKTPSQPAEVPVSRPASAPAADVHNFLSLGTSPASSNGQPIGASDNQFRTNNSRARQINHHSTGDSRGRQNSRGIRRRFDRRETSDERRVESYKQPRRS